MKDYFREAIIPSDIEGIRSDIVELINTDINNYRMLFIDLLMIIIIIY